LNPFIPFLSGNNKKTPPSALPCHILFDQWNFVVKNIREVMQSYTDFGQLKNLDAGCGKTVFSDK
jgi:hypothetical protein